MRPRADSTVVSSPGRSLRYRSSSASSRDRRRILLERVGDHFGPVEQRQDLLVGLGEVESPQEGGHVLATLAVDPDADRVLLVDVELEPGTPARDHLGGEDVPVGGLVDRLVEVDARRAHQLGHHDTLGAVDDEGAVGRHHREVAEEDLLLLDLTGLAVHEASGDEERLRVVGVLLLGLFDGEGRITEPVIRRARARGCR